MATYFSASNNQKDAAMMLYSRDSLPSSYSEASITPENSMIYMNFSSDALPGNPHRQNSCINIQPAGTSESATSREEVMLNFGGPHVVEHNLSSWKDGNNEMLLMHSVNGASDVLQAACNLQGQGLSLSLGTHMPSGMQISPIEYQTTNSGFSSFVGPNLMISSEEKGVNEAFGEDDNLQTKQLNYNEYLLSCIQGNNSDALKADIPSYGVPSIARVISSSKYLKAAQQLLDDVVNVKKAILERNLKRDLTESKEDDGESRDGVSDPSQAGTSSVQPDSSSNPTSELSAAEKQDLQNRLAKLLSMLDEVDRRYKHYYHQMKVVVSSFDATAGSGAAKPYTALALQTISCHFRCLRDAINGQIQVARRSLGEPDDSSNGKGIGISRLRYVDKQLRQQRALHQLGMMPQHAWRPQRGLPETSVSILRAWLFEHFLHPYPKDSDKIMLARQTGLTRSQVSNWFINARVRLWKPMVEEMYKEEAGDAEIDSNSSSETTPVTAKTETKSSQSKVKDSHLTATSSGQLLDSNSKYNDIEMMESDNHPSFQTRAEPQNKCGIRRTGLDTKQIDNSTLFPYSLSNYGNDRFTAAASACHISELERFGGGNGVSLTLGLQQCEGGSIVIANESHGAFTGTDAYNASELAMETETAEFDCLDSEHQQQLFVPSRLFHDFVALESTDGGLACAVLKRSNRNGERRL